MKIVIGSDHAGFPLKEELKQFLVDHDYNVEDKGCESAQSTDYPIYAAKVCQEVAGTENIGILICSNGVGMSIAANKIKGIRAGLAYNESSAKNARVHNHANVLCLGGKEFTTEQGKKFTQTFLKAALGEDERHLRRVAELDELEK
jgi:ribose 5-phosphate isomerase B